MTQTIEQQPGGLYVETPDRQKIAFPLKHTEVQAKVAGNISRVEVTQTFENPFTTTLEAVYIFPLPDEAAVDDMLIRIGDRTIKGSIKKRQEAQQIYEQAKQQGRTAGLLEQERDNIFTQSLANIKPGEEIDVIIRYSDSLKFEAGNYEFVFPMVVGPRYIPGTTIEGNTTGGGSAAAPMTLNQDTDLVPDASRLNAPILPSGTRSRHDINVNVEIDAGVAIRDVRSPSHQIQVTHEEQIVRVKLADGDTISNKDLILRYQVTGDRTQTTVLTQADEKGGHFAVYLIPAIAYQPNQKIGKDVVFLIDTSGSQAGAPLMQCQELMRRFINELNPDDTFSIIDFANTTQQLSPVPLANTPHNRSLAIQYINKLNAGGGTELLRGIRAVLNFPVTDPGRLRSIVLLTDGYIGNENQILAEVQRHLKSGNRLYSFGAGSSVNRFLLNRIAEIGRGISRIIRHDEPTDEVVEKFFRQINNPVLANINLQWEGDGESPTIYPSTPPDLFAEQPLVLFGRKQDCRAGKLHVTGVAAGGTRYQQTFNLNFQETGNPAIAQLWGRSRIKDLMNRMVSGDTKAGVEAVTDTALTYQLLSQYTAFVAVSDDVRVDPTDASVSVQVPVEMPEGVSYEGIFGNVAYNSAPAIARAASDPPEFLQRRKVNYSATVRPAPMSPSSPASAMESSDEFDITLINPGLMFEDDEQLQAPNPQRPGIPPARRSPGMSSVPRLQVISATGLDNSAIALLTQHLESIQLAAGVSGDLVFELQVSKGRVRQVVLDEQASSVKEQTVIEAIRRALLIWRPMPSITSTVVVTLRIQP
ncbi:after-VIT domain-containing protein [Planktothrix sp. FACHB-1355]|uniref:After-VIT domain-containing protein n=1 Tax=Aerosakkonema funiforme FACHB-1375 TaxID=2949571 RepID=A0A926ZFJ6_9CYAN|nr:MULTISPECIES: VIT domain-containing protein [Oscillatoriales]MBD2180744.1 after-VIT domain-containing protein [Aerosakkonema funiforme FACHB-1375]MBD3558425.1 after-VIT domain-containing protein [Planktothrix sp. FACHB-1355]